MAKATMTPEYAKFGPFGGDAAFGHEKQARGYTEVETQEKANLSEKSIFEQAVDKYGPVNQVLMVSEETSELVSALSRWVRGRGDIHSVAEELADVQIMLNQIPHIIEAGGFKRELFRDLVKGFKEKKLTRLRARVAEA